MVNDIGNSRIMCSADYSPTFAVRPWSAAVVLATFVAMSCTPAAERPASSGSWSLSGKAISAESAGGMVTSGHPLASRVGSEILALGGNAIDAAVAVSMALAVVLPEAGNIGGGGFLVYRAAAGEVLALDYRERAPAKASRDMFLDARGEPTDRSVTGHLAAGVPGTVAGMWAMHQRLGSMPWSELLEPAIDLARGHIVDQARSEHLASDVERLSRFPASAAQFLVGGAAPAAGTRLAQLDLARTLERIRDRGADGFYRGEVADLIVAEMERGAGIISHADLESYEVKWRTPVTTQYRGYTLYSMPPPSSGGVTLALLLNVLEGFEPVAASGTSLFVHRAAESMRRAFIERNLYIGDPDFIDVPVERFQSQEFADSLRASIDPARATPTPPFSTWGEGDNTTHYSIVDASGNAASITTTINGWYGSAVVVGGAGFLLNNEMDDFATAPGRPNQYGLVEGENNAVQPGRRMLSSMTPTIVLDPHGDLSLVLGSPGGPTIITTVFQTIVHMIDHQMTLEQAIESPRVHHQALPDAIFFEPHGLEPDVQEQLRLMGHELRERDSTSGDVSAIARTAAGWLGVADPRRGGAASGPIH